MLRAAQGRIMILKGSLNWLDPLEGPVWELGERLLGGRQQDQVLVIVALLGRRWKFLLLRKATFVSLGLCSSRSFLGPSSGKLDMWLVLSRLSFVKRLLLVERFLLQVLHHHLLSRSVLVFEELVHLLKFLHRSRPRPTWKGWIFAEVGVEHACRSVVEDRLLLNLHALLLLREITVWGCLVGE